MAYCERCGNQIDDNAVICVHCGMEVKRINLADSKSGGFAFLCFLIPIVGLILYLVWKKDFPLKASSCGKGALIGAVLYLIWSIF